MKEEETLLGPLLGYEPLAQLSIMKKSKAREFLSCAKLGGA